MRRVATVLVTIVAVALAVLVPNLAFAESAAVCHATKGSSAYEFNGGLALGKTATGYGIVGYAGQFDGMDSEDPSRIPADAKNNFTINILKLADGSSVHGASSPDTIDYGVPYAETPQSWDLPPGQWYFGRYVAAFDKRGTPDAHCTADTPSFPSQPEAPPIQPAGLPQETCEVLTCHDG